MHAATVVVGDRLGLFAQLAAIGPCSADELATATGCHPRLIREWLSAQVASAYCEYDAQSDTFWLTPEQATCLADATSPTYLPGGAIAANANHQDVDRVVRAFSGNGGIDWQEHHPHLFLGTERFFGPVYRGNLLQHWIPALEGVHNKLVTGGRVADLGCGDGVALILMAQAYPASTFAGFDSHAGSIEAAREAAAKAGVSDKVTFEVGDASGFDGADYDLICVFNALHEWGDPLGAARRIRGALAADGTWMFTEPRTDEELTESVRARTFFSVSTFVCTPSALSQGADDALGAQAGEPRLRQVTEQAGFTRFRRATQTPSFMVLEARP
ncbi:class I SAM-dependent methyltransferase [Phytoactinopolyspora limicola]|uniref:class I SAM-dependent methyltransferase n=1 Tax=Phytoactinopolyspora limicola TaxID=2715536 RepID=UPI001A9CABA4|nr:class I SAM-dependent methyltransferase [Phytoactinopolyspora limicola]